MRAFAILFGFSIITNGSTFAAIQGRFGLKLDLPGSVVIPYIPWIALAAYVAAVWALRTVKPTRTRWIGFIIVTVIAHAAICYPIFLLDRCSTHIPVKNLISRESRAAFEAQYPIKFVSYSASRGGACIRVRKDQYSKEMASYVTDLVRKQD
jgi:hypothetical protein